MSPESRRSAGILLVVLPTVILGGVSLLSLLINPESGYMNNPLRQDLWRADHAHAGVLLILSLVALRYVDEAVLSNGVKSFVRGALPAAALTGKPSMKTSGQKRDLVQFILRHGLCHRRYKANRV